MLARSSLKFGTPWAVSLALHIALVGVAAFLAVRAALDPAPAERYIDFDDAGAEPVVEDVPELASAAQPDDGAAPAPPALPAAPAPAPAPAAPRKQVAEVGDSTGPGTAWLAPAPLSSGAASGGDARDGAEAPDLGVAPMGGEVKFAGLGSSNARSVVYVVDASGPMVSSLREVIDELDRSISRLSATQRFGVVAFRAIGDAGGTELFMPVLVRATPKAKLELREWLMTLAPAGRSNPLTGLRAALKLRPDAVFLLSRGIERSGGGLWELGLEATMDELERLNPVHRASGRRRVVIKTIQFLDEDPTGTMQRIGQMHGETVNAAGRAQPGYRVVRRGADLHDDQALEPSP